MKPGIALIKYDPQSSLKNSNQTKLNEFNPELGLLQSLVSERFIYIKQSLQEIMICTNEIKILLRIPTASLSKQTILKKKAG